MKVGIVDKDDPMNIYAEKESMKIINGSLSAGDFYYCEPSDAAWWRVIALKWNHGQQVEGYVKKERIRLFSSLPDTTQKRLIHTVLVKHYELTNKFYATFNSKESASYPLARSVLENHADTKYSPILDAFNDYFCNSRDSLTLIQLFETILADKGSSSEMPCYVLGECYICSNDVFLRQLEKSDNREDLEALISTTEWGLRNHFNVPEEGLDIPPNPEKEQVEAFNVLMSQLNKLIQ